MRERLVAAPASPYKGLTPFEDTELDALLFFGREREREVIAANLIASRLTVLYGVSGVGKSSLLRAGVARRLRELAPEAAVVVYDTWSEDPARGLLDALAVAAPEVARPVSGLSLTDALDDWTRRFGGELYLILDQFEELFVYGPAGPFAEALGEVVTHPGLRVNVLIAVREDSLAQLDVFTGRVPNVFSNYLPLDRLDRDAGRAAIEGPLRRYNELRPGSPPVETEPGLIEAVLDQVAAGRVELAATGKGGATEVPGDAIEAPFLQLVMERLWEEETARGSTTLRLATLEALGGAEAIVQAHLERAVGALASGEKDVAARIFHHLVTPSGTKIAHRVGDLAHYAAVPEDQLRSVLARLGEERIIRPSDGRYEIFHDVLADAVLAWRAAHQARRDLERRHRRALVVAGGSLVLVAVMLAVTIFALAQRSEAREQARLARAEARVAKARELDAEAIAQLAVDPELGLLLATEAARLSPTVQAESVLLDALLASRVRRVARFGSPVVAAGYSPNGRRLVVASARGAVAIIDVARSRLVKKVDVGAPVTGASFSPDGRRLLVSDAAGSARIWSATGKPLRVLRHGGRITSASFSSDGALVLTTGRDGVARTWRTDDGTPVATVQLGTTVRKASFGPGGRLVIAVGSDTRARVFDASTGGVLFSLDHGARVTDALISPTGRLMVTAGRDGKIRIWGPRGARLDELVGHRGPVLAIAAQPQGRLLATASRDGTGRVWTLADGEPLALLTGHSSAVTSVAFSPDGFSLVTTSRDGTARVWKPGTGERRAVLVGHEESVTSAAFSPNGKVVLTVSEDGTARTWSPQAQPELDRLARPGGPLLSAGVSPDGRLIAVAGRRGVRLLRADDGRVVRTLTRRRAAAVDFSPDGELVGAAVGRRAVVWRAATGSVAVTLAHPAEVTDVAFGRGGLVATAGRDRLGRVWSADGQILRLLRGHGGVVTGIAFSPDGRRLVTASRDRTARIWNLEGEVLRVLHGHRAPLTSAAFSADGRLVVTTGEDSEVRTWEATGRPLRALVGHFGTVRAATFSSDGRWIATAGPRTAGLWSARSGLRPFQLRGHRGPLTAALFDPAGRVIFTAGLDGTVRRYRCEVCGGIDSLLALAERRLTATGRKLTPAERRRYFGG